MKPAQNATIVNMPRNTTVVVDDSYLVEMTDRLQRLRALVKAQERSIESKAG